MNERVSQLKGREKVAWEERARRGAEKLRQALLLRKPWGELTEAERIERASLELDKARKEGTDKVLPVHYAEPKDD